MRLTHSNERPSAIIAGCAHVHASRVGRSVVHGAPTYRWLLAGQPVAFINQFKQEESVQLHAQDARARFQGANGLTTQAIRMAQSPIVVGVKVSGVPPRGRPV